MSRRRVLVVTNMWPGEKTAHNGVFVKRQVEALRNERPDWRFDVMTIAGSRGRGDYLAAVPRLRRRLARGYDLVHAHYGLSGVTAALAGARPLVTTLHGGEIEVGWQKPVTRLAIRRSAAVIAVSAWVRQGFGDPAMRVISCGVPTALFEPRDRTEARGRLGLPPEVPVMLFPADPREPIKDHALFRLVLRLVRNHLPDTVELTLGVPPEDVPWHMAAADVVVLTSQQESGPLVVKEAIACGVPVVAVDVGDVATTLVNLPGCHVLPRDPDALASAALDVLRSRGRGRSQAADALRRQRIFELGLDDVSVARQVLDLYERVLGGRARQVA